MKKTPPCRLDILFAAEANTAVILRQGPTRHVRLIAWHTATDTFTPGQWVKHRVYEEKCDLSPDGTHLAYFAFDGRNHDGAFIDRFSAISKVPYFTALGWIVEGGTWGDGGRFMDNRHVFCPYLHSDRIAPLPPPLEWVWHPQAYGVGWNEVPQPRDHAPEYFLRANGNIAPIESGALARFLAAWPPRRKKQLCPIGARSKTGACTVSALTRSALDYAISTQ